MQFDFVKLVSFQVEDNMIIESVVKTYYSKDFAIMSLVEMTISND